MAHQKAHDVLLLLMILINSFRCCQLDPSFTTSPYQSFTEYFQQPLVLLFQEAKSRITLDPWFCILLCPLTLIFWTCFHGSICIDFVHFSSSLLIFYVMNVSQLLETGQKQFLIPPDEEKNCLNLHVYQSLFFISPNCGSSSSTEQYKFSNTMRLQRSLPFESCASRRAQICLYSRKIESCVVAYCRSSRGSAREIDFIAQETAPTVSDQGTETTQ